MAQRTVNTASGELLLGFISRIERVREEKKALSDDEKLVFAEAKAQGFSTKRIGNVLKIRAMKPTDREEAEAELDMYLHAVGMAKEAPLFRAVGLLSVDPTVRDQVIDAVKLLVPPGGEFIVKVGGAPLRIWRDDDGEARAEDYVEPGSAPKQGKGGGHREAPRADVPDCTPEEAEGLGRTAYKADLPIIKNPFPWNDKRRPRWDAGWRLESGSDGMGPDDKED